MLYHEDGQVGTEALPHVALPFPLPVPAGRILAHCLEHYAGESNDLAGLLYTSEACLHAGKHPCVVLTGSTRIRTP
jgi:hypothetical protein